QAQPELPRGRARARAREAWGQRALEPLLGNRTAVAEQTEPHRAVCDNRPAAIAAAQTLPCSAAAWAALGMAPIRAASPSTWIPGCRVDSKPAGSIGHQPVRSATPAAAAIGAARCGGTMLATAAL